MVDTRVSNPEHRTINRKIGRHKRSRTKHLKKLADDQQNPTALAGFYSHTLKIEELKQRRNKLKKKQESS